MDSKEIGARLRKARKSTGKSLQYVADALNCSVQSISQYERGIRPLKVETVQKIADALGVSAVEIMGIKNVAPGREEITLQNEKWKEMLGSFDGALKKRLGLDLTADESIIRNGSGKCLIYAETTISAPTLGRRVIDLVENPNDFQYVCVPKDVAYVLLNLMQRMNSKGHEHVINYAKLISTVPDCQYNPDAES